ncbi:MAG: S-layer homology domain-containing protein [Erysipelotrichaceae bacterium]|nr:S-layer homology domain-containing protein [Erysipelotrichaceae bacterium]
MKTITRILIHILCFVLLLSVSGTKVNASEEAVSRVFGEDEISWKDNNESLMNAEVIPNEAGWPEPASISIEPEKCVLAVGTVGYFDVTVLPAEADQRVTWSSSNEKVLTVASDGYTEAINVGKTVLSATTVNGLTATCDISVDFFDVDNIHQYFFEPVYWALENGITNGYGKPGYFCPGVSCTREQFVTFLWRMEGKPEPEEGCTFSDVPESAWYYKSISWAAEKGITTGLNDGTNRFGVGQACTREQCVTFLHRAADTPEPTGSIEFTDSKEGKYYYKAIKWAAGKGITVGLNDGTGRFGVGQKCSRGMLVTFLYRYAHAN